MEAVNRKAGGNNHELAKEIASEHLATGSYSCIDDHYILTKKCMALHYVCLTVANASLSSIFS